MTNIVKVNKGAILALMLLLNSFEPENKVYRREKNVVNTLYIFAIIRQELKFPKKKKDTFTLKRLSSLTARLVCAWFKRAFNEEKERERG